MTYLELVNNVLTRMRENTVSNVTQSPYSSLIATLINDAKYDVEHAWDWSGLRTTIQVQVVAGTSNYTITGSSSTYKNFMTVNTDEEAVMRQVSFTRMKELLTLEAQTGKPDTYAFNGLDTATNDAKVDVYPIPDATYYIDFTGIAHTDPLVANTDVLTIPEQPVLLLAWAKAIEERGEDGGMATSMAYAYAKQALADAVAMDAGRHEAETIWTTV